MKDMIDVDRLRLLIALADTGTVTAAAEALHYGQPTVSHHLRRLEAETGATLVTQVGRRLRLTAEGEHLVRRGRPILAALDQAEREVRAMTALEAGMLRLAAFPSAIPTLIPPLLDRLGRAAPGLSTDLVEAEPSEAAVLLRDGVVDVALTFSYPDGPPEPELTHVPLGEDPLYLVRPVRQGRPTRAGRADRAGSVSLHQFSEATWIAGCERCRGHLLAACAAAGFEPRIGYISDDYVAAQALLAARDAVTLLPGLALRAHTNPAVRCDPVPGQARTVHASTIGRPEPPAVRLAVECAQRLTLT